ncbi:MAG: SWIM zinc finger family protein [Planctomycetia bacterium]|nr:SWIM zinc finger family protein [Planctomycetia bacterium]
MGAALKLDYTYRYVHPSLVTSQPGNCGLRLATCGGAAENPFFFDGKVRQPHVAASMLLVLAKVVSTRFWMPLNPSLLDPVVTSSEELLRFEGFSSCCGVYARADFEAPTFEADIKGRGTTNVDFNSSMRAALAQIRQSDTVRMAVGADSVQLTRGEQQVVEKKVKLPVRWIKGFTEVQAYLPVLNRRFTITASEALRFLRAIPKGGSTGMVSWVTSLGRGLRLSQRESKDAVRVTGTERIRILEPLLMHATELHVWADANTEVSAWEVVFPTGRFTILISPELTRGFSGEGQVLQQLASSSCTEALPQVKAGLRWQSRIDVAEVSRQSSLAPSQVTSALAVLGSRGLVGYDLHRGAYFHRELPFDLEKVEALQPRMLDARQLVEAKLVRVISKMGADEELNAEAYVQGTEVEHRVRLKTDGDSCTCPWYGKHQGDRGPCKHVLAVRLMLEGKDD